MVCDKCGTEVTKNDKFCTKCGAEVKKQEKKNGIIKPIIIIGLILVAVILCIVMKYYAIIPLTGFIILFITVLINRKILKMRKKNKTEKSIAEYNLSDVEMKKFAGYFVSREEKYLSSLGNGYIMNFFANGSLKRGFAVISDKRVYFRGSCFSGQGQNLKITDEERTVDIRDVTGSGFIYRRYLGVLLGLFTALVVLIGGILGCAAGALVSLDRTLGRQQKEETAATNYHSAQNADERIGEIEEEIEELEDKKVDLQSDLDEKVALQQEEVIVQEEEVIVQALENMTLDEYLHDTEFNVAFEEYLKQTSIIFEESETYFLLSCLENGANYFYEYSELPDSGAFYVGEAISHGEPNFDGNCLLDIYNRNGSLHVSVIDVMTEIYGYEHINEALRYAYNYKVLCDTLAYDYDNAYTCNDMINNGWVFDPNEVWHDGRFYDDWWFLEDLLFDSDEAKAYDQAYKDFVNKVAPDYVDIPTSEYTLEELVLTYLQNNPDAVLTDKVDLSGISTKYDEDVQKITADISAIDAKIAELTNESATLSIMSQDIEKYEDAYNARKKENLGYYMLTTVAMAGAGLLVTFFISCVAVLVDYLSKRKTLFEIQYAGGRIAFDVSYYAKAEIDDFQKQLRRAKDFAQETATVKTVTVEAPVQTPVQAPTQSSVPDDLRKYAELLKEGLISQEEYDAMKKKILGL